MNRGKSYKDVIEYTQKADRLRQSLNLKEGIWKNLPNELLLSAFVPKNNNASITLKEILKEYGVKDNEIDEFFGDAVLELLVTEIVLSFPSVNEHTGTKIRQEIVRNTSLDCFMHSKNLCNEIYTRDFGKKTCANSFEALIGVLWYWLRSEQYTNAWEEMKRWFMATWKLDEVASEFMKKGSIDCKLVRDNRQLSTKPFPCAKNVEELGAKSPTKKSPPKKIPDEPKILKKPKTPPAIAILPKPASKSPVKKLRSKPKSPLILKALSPPKPPSKSPSKSPKKSLRTSPRKSPPKTKKVSESRLEESYSGDERGKLAAYNKLTVEKLRVLATSKGIKWRNLRKAELIEELMQHK